MFNVMSNLRDMDYVAVDLSNVIVLAQPIRISKIFNRQRC